MELMKKILFILMMSLSQITFGQGNYFMWHKTVNTITATVPEVTTLSITAIAQTTATVNGNVVNDGRSGITSAGICWNTTGTPTTADNTASGSNLANFTASMTGLTANTTYYVRALATNSVGIGYGNQISFTTSPVSIVVPTVTLQPIAQTEETTAYSGGNVVDGGGATVSARGVCWNTTGTPTTSSSKTTNGTGIGVYTSSLTSLSCGTTYYVRAYATNSAGTGYSNQISFVSQNNGEVTYLTTFAQIRVGGVDYTPTDLATCKFMIDSQLSGNYSNLFTSAINVDYYINGGLLYNTNIQCRVILTRYFIRQYPDGVTYDIFYSTGGVISSILRYP
jgi:hypothetical protein